MVSKPGDRLLHAAHDASLRTLDKVNDMVNLGTGGYLVLYLLYGIVQTLIACIYNAIGVGDVTQRALVDTFLLKDNSGNAMIADWIASKDDIGGAHPSGQRIRSAQGYSVPHAQGAGE